MEFRRSGRIATRPLTLARYHTPKDAPCRQGGHYRGPALILGAVVYAFHLGLGAALCAMGLGASSLEVLWPVWCARWGVDALLLYRMREGDLWGWLKYFPLVEVLYIPYVVLLAPAGRLGLFRWKS